MYVHHRHMLFFLSLGPTFPHFSSFASYPTKSHEICLIQRFCLIRRVYFA